MIRRTFSLVALSTAITFGCGDTPAPTQPRVSATPTPVPGALAISVKTSLTRLDAPPGAAHAALATLLVKETLGRTVRLTGFRAYNYSGTGDVAVSGFTPKELGPAQSVTYSLTLTSTRDIPCADELWLIVSYDNGTQNGGLGSILDCSTGEWLF